MIYGEEVPQWRRFKEVAGLSHKPDEMVQAYYEKIMGLCSKVLQEEENRRRTNDNRPATTLLSKPEEGISPERARR